MSKIQSVKGMHDVLPEDNCSLRNIENIAQQVLDASGYQQIRFPILERTSLFKRSIGDATDIVEKEMYSFQDVSGEWLSLRPEGTASCVRACLQHGMIGKEQRQRLWYQGSFFRRERPQKGRYRQFSQIGAEAFGYAGVDIEAEMLALTFLLWERLGLSQQFTLKINTLGSTDARKRYRRALIDYFTEHYQQLDTDAQRRMKTNPFRVLDSKNTQTKAIVSQAPYISDYLDATDVQHYERLKAMLRQAQVPFVEDLYLVRGLDYYTHTVFEWVQEQESGQDTVCAGGRYDNLVEQLGGSATPASGFAIGLDRLLLACKEQDNDLCAIKQKVDIYIVAIGDDARKYAVELALNLRRHFPEKQILAHCDDGTIKAQMRRANKFGAEIALLIGDEELVENVVSIKWLQQNVPQEKVDNANVISRIQEIFS